ncbi:MAG TPA: hypothetical protein VGJ77_10870 [Gaiellaceae bacterium]
MLAALLLILPACGGGGGGNETQVVRGDGFRFEAPSGWDVRGTVATDGAVDRVGVSRFRLVKPYRPALFEAAAMELDRVADRLAGELGGRVAARRTVTAAGARARSYRIDYDGKTTEVTFVLSGRREYQLLCRRRSDTDDAVCRQLVSSFRLT